MQKVALCAAALALGGCAVEHGDPSSEARRRKDAGSVIAVDAAPGGSTDPVGTVSCYTEGAPGATCTLPVHCCFSNYSAQHDGYCTASECAWGAIGCDGPEDCATGEYCCANARRYGGWTIGCQATPCGTSTGHEELCHDTSTCTAGTCASAYGLNYDLPRTLSICR